MTALQSADYREFFAHAIKFHKLGKNGFIKRPEIFTNEILYNVFGLAIEKYVMALMTFNGEMPEGHTFYDLLEAAKTKVEIPDKLYKQLIDLESYQNLCPVFNPKGAKDIPDTAIHTIIDATNELASIVEENI